MKFQFEPNQAYQLDAIAAAVNVLPASKNLKPAPQVPLI